MSTAVRSKHSTPSASEKENQPYGCSAQPQRDERAGLYHGSATRHPALPERLGQEEFARSRTPKTVRPHLPARLLQCLHVLAEPCHFDDRVFPGTARREMDTGREHARQRISAG